MCVVRGVEVCGRSEVCWHGGVDVGSGMCIMCACVCVVYVCL